MGLGSFPEIGVAEARDRAIAARRLLIDGIDPLEARRASEDQERAKIAQAISFRECADKYIAAHEDSWRNLVHRKQWRKTLDVYVHPVIGSMPVNEIDTASVMRVLQPIWRAKTETASRVRGRVETVLDYAATHGWRGNDNPAAWSGHLENVLPARGKIEKVEHHRALAWCEIGAFMADLAKRPGVAAAALKFVILTLKAPLIAVGR